MSGSTSITPSEGSSSDGREEIISTVSVLGHRVLRYGLAVVIGWIGLMKFTGYEAQAIVLQRSHLLFPTARLGAKSRRLSSTFCDAQASSWLKI
jgi:hypothetical protein